MSKNPYLRTAAVPKEISDISTEDAGRRIRVRGFVVNLQEESVLILSDDTGQIAVTVEKPPALQAFVRIFGTVAVSSDGQPMIRAELIQDLTGLDIKLQRLALNLLKRASVTR